MQNYQNLAKMRLGGDGNRTINKKMTLDYDHNHYNAISL